MIDGIYVKSMGKIFKVRKACYSEIEANKFCKKNKDTGVIAVDKDSGMIFIADLYAVTVKSNLLP